MSSSDILVVKDVSAYAEDMIRELVLASGIDMSPEVAAYLVQLTSRSVNLSEWLEGDEEDTHAEYTLLFDMLRKDHNTYEERLGATIRLGDIALLRLALFWDWVRERSLQAYYVDVGSGGYLRAGVAYQADLQTDIPSLTDTVFHQLARHFEDYAALMWDLFITDSPHDEKLLRRFDRFSGGETRYGRAILSTMGFTGFM